MNPRLALLKPYPFEKLAALTQGITPDPSRSPISLAIGEPRHEVAPLLVDAIARYAKTVSSYPSTRGHLALREAIAAWLAMRFGVTSIDPAHDILPVSGTREALFAVVQAAIDSAEHPQPVVMMPNPFYQIYEGAALLAGAEPYYLNTDAAHGFRPDFEAVPQSIWARTRLVFVCSPGNPTGAVLEPAHYQTLFALADRYGFLIASDECYSEIYFDESAPPPGLLGVAQAAGRRDFRHCLVFHSLSKRSNLPGLRSGFVAGDREFLRAFHHYRTYQGSALSSLAQAVSTVAWADEAHVRDNRALYCQKFAYALKTLAPVRPVTAPDAGFYLWLTTAGSDTDFAADLYARENVRVLPGSYLSRPAHGHDPGAGYVRLALVATPDECEQAIDRLAHYTVSTSGARDGYAANHRTGV